MIVAFTGHRPAKLGGYGPSPIRAAVEQVIFAELHAMRPEKAISGMALGVDQWAFEQCLKLNIPVIAAVPFAEQASKWPPASQQHYTELLSRACEIVQVSPPGYAAWKMQRRNEYMVHHCDELWAVWDGSPSGGTANCVRFAMQIGRPVRNLWAQVARIMSGPTSFPP